MRKLVILRGPSASGKSTIAQALRDKSSRKIAVLEFDSYRDNILAKQDGYYDSASEMFVSDAIIAFKHGFDVIMDGIFRFNGPNRYMDELLKAHPEENYMFYFDISLETTIKRHEGRDKSDSFSVDQLKQWFYEPTPSGFDFEEAIPGDAKVQETIELIQDRSGL